LIDNPEFVREPNIRYYIYGGFHHVSIEHARALEADIICIAPDGVHSDESFTNYVRFVDRGYQAVLFTSTRGQAETLLPELDAMRDEDSQSLTLPSRILVDLAVRHIHHEFLQYIMTTEHQHYPAVLSRLFFLTPRGFHSRNFHLHPIIIAAEALKKDIRFDYHTVDAALMAQLIPDPNDWSKIKILDDSDDGVMLDLTFAFVPPPVYAERSFTLEHLLHQLPNFRTNHLWHFAHRITYRGSVDRESFRTFDVSPDGTLTPREIPVSSAIDMTDSDIAGWFEAHRPDHH
jgi:hypothetical protein